MICSFFLKSKPKKKRNKKRKTVKEKKRQRVNDGAGVNGAWADIAAGGCPRSNHCVCQRIPMPLGLPGVFQASGFVLSSHTKTSSNIFRCFFLFHFFDDDDTAHAHTHTQTAKGTEDAVFCNSFKELPLQVFFDVKTIDGQPFITCLFAPFSSSLRTTFSHLSFSPSHCRLSMTTQRY